jgi:hypothetical protein
MAKRKPKGDCYEASYYYLLNNADSQNGKIAELFKVSVGEIEQSVHGFPLGTKGEVAGRYFGHAWIEFGNIVYDVANGQTDIVPRSLYYDNFSIDENEVKYYTKKEAIELGFKHRHFGAYHTPDRFKNLPYKLWK